MSMEHLVQTNDPTVTLSVTSTTGNVALAMQSPILYIQNTGAKLCFIATGGSTVTATTSSLPIPSGKSVTLRHNNLEGYIAAICGGTDTTTLYITSCNGVVYS